MDDLSTMDDSYTMDDTFTMDKLVDSDGQLQRWTWRDGWFRKSSGCWRLEREINEVYCSKRGQRDQR